MHSKNKHFHKKNKRPKIVSTTINKIHHRNHYNLNLVQKINLNRKDNQFKMQHNNKKLILKMHTMHHQINRLMNSIKILKMILNKLLKVIFFNLKYRISHNGNVS